MQEYPTVLERVQSSLIDSVIVIAGMLLFSESLSFFQNVPDWVRVVLFMLVLLYEPLCTTFGATLGNHKMNIRVRSNSDPEKRINLFQAIIRFFFKALLGWLSFLAIFISPRSRTFHDMICGSVMIRVH